MPSSYEPRKRLMALPPSPGQMANRRLLTFLLAAAGIVTFFFIAFRAPAEMAGPAPHGGAVVAGGSGGSKGVGNDKAPIHAVTVDAETLSGEAIMPKLGNETLKAELGRAAWKLFHTTMARFPERPTADEQTALASYIHLFARLYPCGECAAHFRAVLLQYPPQVSGRNAAAAWACFVHNVVNQSLGKAEFDCAAIGDFYDCGCAEDDGEAAKKGAAGKGADGDGKKSGRAGAEGAKAEEEKSGSGDLILEKEDKTLGG